MNVFQVVKRPVVTEKTTTSNNDHAYVFEVDLRATKHDIRAAVEELFNVKVARVNTAVMQGKRKRFGRVQGKRSNWKKAVVTVREGHTINLFPEDELADAEAEA